MIQPLKQCKIFILSLSATLLIYLYLPIYIKAECYVINDVEDCVNNPGCICYDYGAGGVLCQMSNPWYATTCGDTGFWIGQRKQWQCTTGDSACVGDPSCFLSGTQISTPSGDAAIESLKTGDRVENFDPKTGSISAGKVTKNYARQSDSYYLVETQSGKQIKVTGEHPIFTGEGPQPSPTWQDKYRQGISKAKNYLKAGWWEVVKVLNLDQKKK